MHRMISEEPYVFSRMFESGDFRDRVVVGLNMKAGKKEIDLGGHFDEGTVLRDYYSGQQVTVKEGKAELDSPHEIVLLGI